ncbi:MAG TPA: M15 family metallopeptidase [Desulfomonilia bacterium]
MNNRGKHFVSALITLALLIPAVINAAQPLPEGFVYLDDVIPGIRLEMRYYSDNNFTGRRVDGYLKPRCIISKPAALALKKVQDDLLPFGLELKIFDAYRPQAAVDNFIRWAADIGDTKMKKEYYPDVDKTNLFRDGYIASRSGHTRGSTVDLTIIQSGSGKELDMGGTFDFFGPVSWPDSSLVQADKKANRLLLRTLMIMYGFKPYDKEWWHFTLANEPYPNTYFNFPVE